MVFLLVVEVLFRLFQLISYCVTFYELFKHTIVPVALAIRDFRYGRQDTVTTNRRWYHRSPMSSPVDVRNMLPFSRYEKSPNSD
jgi:hypothetical protein